MKKGFTLVEVVMIAALLIALATLVLGCARVEQASKSWQSVTTGIPRRVELYSFDGKKLKEYDGAQVLLDFNSNHVEILVDNKRVTASNVVVVSEER